MSWSEFKEVMTRVESVSLEDRMGAVLPPVMRSFLLYPDLD